MKDLLKIIHPIKRIQTKRVSANDTGLKLAVMNRTNYCIFYYQGKLHCLSMRGVAKMFDVPYRSVARKLNNGKNIMQAVGLEPIDTHCSVYLSGFHHV